MALTSRKSTHWTRRVVHGGKQQCSRTPKPSLTFTTKYKCGINFSNPPKTLRKVILSKFHLLNVTYVYHVCRVTGWGIRKFHWHNTKSKYLNYYIKLQIYQFLWINKLSYDLTRKSVKRTKTKTSIIISVLREAWSLICTTHTHTHTKRKKTGIPFAQWYFVPSRKKNT